MSRPGTPEHEYFVLLAAMVLLGAWEGEGSASKEQIRLEIEFRGLWDLPMPAIRALLDREVPGWREQQCKAVNALIGAE
jgi:hypothetical protein